MIFIWHEAKHQLKAALIDKKHNNSRWQCHEYANILKS